MEVFEAISRRRSIRAYLPDMLSKEILEKILEAARLAPSAVNIHPVHVVVVTDQQKRRELGGMFARFLSKAPVVIVGCGNKKASPKWYVVDTAIAMQNMVLAATGEGLGTCWVSSFDEDNVRRLLRIPSDFSVIALLAVGYPREKFDISAKAVRSFKKDKYLEEMISVEEFGNSYVSQNSLT